MSVTSSSPSPSPTLTPPASVLQQQQQQQQQQHQFSTKPGALVAAVKQLLSEQSARLLLKHNTDLDLLEDFRVYLKNLCALERDYSQSLAKLNQSYAKRSSTFLNFCTSEDENSNIKTIYTAWRIYQEEMEKHAKYRQQQFEQMASICETLKTLRSHKTQVAKKCLDNYLKKMHEEVVNSVNEIDKTRKLYFEEEHLAKQARDKEEKIKKRKTGIFASFSSLQNKKERTSAHREASDIQSTQARNDYLMALAAGNAHLEHYYNQDLTNLMLTIDDTVLDKCRSNMLSLLQAEKDSANQWWELIERSMDTMDKTSADYTNSVFLKDPNSSPLTETLFYEFQPCDNDPIDYISLEHNADIALRNEGQKWFTWFCKECRNLNRLSAQLVKLQALLSDGHKTVDLAGSGQVDIESRIDEIRQQIRKCEISKLKAKARLQAIKDSGAEVDDFLAFEQQVANEIKQSLDVDTLATAALSRTPSVRSHTELEMKSSLKNDQESADYGANASRTHPNLRPESSSSIEQLDSPDREMLQMGTSMESTSPGPTAAGVYSATEGNQSSWGDPLSGLDPTQAWDSEPPDSTAMLNDQQQQQPVMVDNNGAETKYESSGQHAGLQENYSYDSAYGDSQQPQHQTEESMAVDGYGLIGKQCFALYSYTAQNEDELSFMEQELLTVLDASDKDWVRAENKDGQVGYVPASYLQAMPAESQWNDDSQLNAAYDDTDGLYQTQPVDQTNDQQQADYDSGFPSATLPPPPPPPPLQPSQEPGLPEAPPPPPTSSITSSANISGQAEANCVQALYDYVATNSEEISFKAGDLIKIIDSSSDDGWWTGANPQGQIGHFPSMLVSAPDEDVDEEEDEDADESEEDDDHDEDGSALPPPSINLPPIVEMEPPPPPPPPPLPPLPVPTTEKMANEEFVEKNDPQLPLPPPPPLPQPPSFAPPPKPMQLMAPQAVVIIQPTPEIESRPTIGSGAQQPHNSGSKTDNTDSNDDDGGQGELPSPPSTSSSMAQAAQEISETITQRAMDDSIREVVERRRSSATSVSSSTAQEQQLPQPPPSATMSSNSHTNVEIVFDEPNGDLDDEEFDDEDIK